MKRVSRDDTSLDIDSVCQNYDIIKLLYLCQQDRSRVFSPVCVWSLVFTAGPEGDLYYLILM